MKTHAQASVLLPQKFTAIYYVSCPSDNTVLIAFDVEVKDGVVRWLDSVKDRVMEYEHIIDSSQEHFIFKRTHREGGGIYTFIPLTLSIFREHVKDRILIPQDFKTEEELFAAIQETRKNIW